jgi:membrane protein implicated in regulation of membrane protease activity
MDFSASTVWWGLAGLLLIAELASGTVYLLMLALGAAAGGVAAFSGLDSTPQIMIAAACASGLTAVWHLRRMKHPRSAPADQNRDVNLDIGEDIWVKTWAVDGTARVSHRGTHWAARIAPGHAAHTGKHKIFATEGNTLILKPSDAAV